MRESTMTLGSIHRRGVTSVIQAAERASQASELIETKNVPFISLVGGIFLARLLLRGGRRGGGRAAGQGKQDC